MFHVPLAFLLYGCSDEGGENGDGEDGSEILEEGRNWRLLYAVDLVLCGKLENEIRAMVGCCVEM